MALQTRVGDVMTTDGVVTFSPDEAVLDAMRRLVEAGQTGGPVLDERRAVVGMLSDSDLIVREAQLHGPTVLSLLGASLVLPSAEREFEEDLHKALGQTVREVMSMPPLVVLADATVEEVATVLHDHDVARVAVVDDDGRFLGVMARTDILRAILAADGST